MSHKKYTAVIIGGNHSGLKFDIHFLPGIIEVPDYDDSGELVHFVYYRQPAISPIKEGGIVFFKPNKKGA